MNPPRTLQEMATELAETINLIQGTEDHLTYIVSREEHDTLLHAEDGELDALLLDAGLVSRTPPFEVKIVVMMPVDLSKTVVSIKIDTTD